MSGPLRRVRPDDRGEHRLLRRRREQRAAQRLVLEQLEERASTRRRPDPSPSARASRRSSPRAAPPASPFCRKRTGVARSATATAARRDVLGLRVRQRDRRVGEGEPGRRALLAPRPRAFLERRQQRARAARGAAPGAADRLLRALRLEGAARTDPPRTARARAPRPRGPSPSRPRCFFRKRDRAPPTPSSPRPDRALPCACRS